MTSQEPVTDLDPRYSSEGATAVPWSNALELLRSAELFWISTVRPEGRPHVTPLPAVWWEGALHFATGPKERKARNLAGNAETVLTTGTNLWDKGFDLVVEGTAERVADEERLRALAAAWEDKYGSFWHYEVRDGCFHHGAGHAYVFAVAPRTVFGFGKGERYSQTRWRFAG
ncbi:pyridoxamine 5'-phosphate oxidase family protein [Streptomyces sp. G45]|uniref:pyridoxamine 5'-phosphate oxidase family protein n=1 Tax=Streptomyces sp. G45 TaxID=3406627 RepID=UPI003C27E5F6